MDGNPILLNAHVGNCNHAWSSCAHKMYSDLIRIGICVCASVNIRVYELHVHLNVRKKPLINETFYDSVRLVYPKRFRNTDGLINL